MELSEYICKSGEAPNQVKEKKLRPLKLDKNLSHMDKSFLAQEGIEIIEFGLDFLMVRLCKRRKKARPEGITDNDCTREHKSSSFRKELPETGFQGVTRNQAPEPGVKQRT